MITIKFCGRYLSIFYIYSRQEWVNRSLNVKVVKAAVNKLRALQTSRRFVSSSTAHPSTTRPLLVSLQSTSHQLSRAPGPECDRHQDYETTHTRHSGCQHTEYNWGLLTGEICTPGQCHSPPPPTNTTCQPWPRQTWRHPFNGLLFRFTYLIHQY